jgi:hypothetical protein
VALPQSFLVDLQDPQFDFHWFDSVLSTGAFADFAFGLSLPAYLFALHLGGDTEVRAI